MSRTRADNAFIEEHRKLVEGLARKTHREFDLNVELDDLISFGFTGLLEAHQRFDASKGVRFETFAYYRIRGAIIDGVRQMAWLPKSVHDRLKRADAADEVTESAGEEQAAVPVARRSAEQTLSKVDETLNRLAASFVLSALGIEDTDEEREQSPEDYLLRKEAAARLRAVIPTLPERELALVKGYYFEGRQFNDVAKDIGISKAWASRLHVKALDKLREALEPSEAA